ncbi:hypothetical protein PMIN06_011863 [Paraphaeosphaeria minitans]|uniref:Uncharacterized protein n=1 Tax=Paraphaeosphaeria minitans TaxID=565426 RepID=A0A9P6KWQ6_9PLEO|nr:hypothetical protein PMIN01_01266 [Paraphaeosphaeria minitans]
MSRHPQLLQPNHEQHVLEIRQLSLRDRQSLNTDPAVKLFDGGEYIMHLPRKLFLAATTNPLLIDDRSEILLPPNTGREAILSIGFHLLALTTSPRPFKLRSKNNLEEDLRILEAARLLHLEPYVAHIHNWYWWKLRNRPIDAADVHIVLKVALNSQDPFVRLVGEKIAAIIRDGTADGVEKLNEYVAGQPYLNSIVAREDKRYYATMENQAHKAKRIARQGARTESKVQLDQALVEDDGHLSGPVERRLRDASAEQIKSAQKDSARWEERRKEEAELGRSLQKKMRLGKKVAVLTRAEARHYERTKGKRCPYKISG